MSEVLRQFHFLRPWWLVALVLLPLLWALGARRSQAQLALSPLVDAELLPHLLRGRAAHRYLPLGLVGIGWTLCALALAGPSWNRVPQPLYAQRPAQVLAISLSRDMLARDVVPSRLDRARYKARDLLAANRDGLNALIGYAGEAFVVAPLTFDVNSLGDLLDAMAPDTMPVDGNNAARAIERGVALIHDANTATGSLVLITDQADADAVAAARKALASGVRVSVLGVGTPQGAPVPLADGGFLHDAQGHMQLAGRDDAALTALAAAGGGRYEAMTADHADVDALRGELRAVASTTVAGVQGDEWQDRGPWLLLPLLPLAALAFRRGWLLLLPLVVLPLLLPATAHAAVRWRDLWQRPDQQAAQALRAGAAKQAQQLARDPAWRGAADYRAGDYAAAVQALQHAAGTDGAYNRGNALARQGQYAQAIAAYTEALKRDPANADAKANRQAVEDWLRRQKPKQPPPPQPGTRQSKPPPSKPQDGQGASSPQQGKDGQPGAQGKDAKPDASQAQSGQSGKSAGQNGANPQKPPASDAAKSPATSASAGQASGETSAADLPRHAKAGADPPPAHASSSATDQPPPQTAQQQAEQHARVQRAQQALQQQMDKALAGRAANASGKPPTHQLGATAQEDPQSKLPVDLQHALQRVPDDPGALLRRKFELEYQQRHGGAPDEDGQP
jgi:Ca-activated chloride channel family protein